jgi:hypothetical protein
MSCSLALQGPAASPCKANEQLITWNVQGPKGDKGDSGIADIITITSAVAYSVGLNSATVPCPSAQYRVMGGGIAPPAGAPLANFVQTLSYPSGLSAWTVAWTSTVNAGPAATAFAVCLRPTT